MNLKYRKTGFITRLNYLTQRLSDWDISNSDCLIWPYWKNEKGYGKCFGENSKPLYVHRVAYALINGEIPDDYEIDHTCEVTSCFNPTHLEAVTREEHNRRTQERMGGHYKKRTTHCPQGHELIEGNLVFYRLKKSERVCLTCQRKHGKEYMQRRRNKA